MLPSSILCMGVLYLYFNKVIKSDLAVGIQNVRNIMYPFFNTM